MPNDARLENNRDRILWEALVSLHLGLAAGSIALMLSFPMMAFFSRMESRIKVFLHFQQTDLVYGHVAVWIPSVLMAFAIWAALRATARSPLTQTFLRVTAGIVNVCLPGVVWMVIYQTTPSPGGWPYAMVPFELVAALVFTLQILSGRWRVPFRAYVLLVAVHYVFWYFELAQDYFTPGYAGLGGPILGFCSSVGWGLYICHMRRDLCART